MAQGIVVRRVKASDADDMAAFINRFLTGQAKIDRQRIIERFGSVGFMLAEWNGKLVGTLGWRAENLVVRVSDLLIGSVPDRVAVGRALLAEMEQAAIELQCEVVLLFLPRPTSPRLVEFCRTLGYEPQVVASLPQAWREAAREVQLGDDETLLIKELRSGRVFRPL